MAICLHLLRMWIESVTVRLVTTRNHLVPTRKPFGAHTTTIWCPRNTVWCLTKNHCPHEIIWFPHETIWCPRETIKFGVHTKQLPTARNHLVPMRNHPVGARAKPVVPWRTSLMPTRSRIIFLPSGSAQWCFQMYSSGVPVVHASVSPVVASGNHC
jgi:hypothetical protein